MTERFMEHCHSKQLRFQTMTSYEQTMERFACWLEEAKPITPTGKVAEVHFHAGIVE